MRRLTPREVELYDVVPAELARRVRVQRLPLIAPGVRGVTLGRLIVLHRRADGPRGQALLIHELAHVGQYAELGTARFLWRYLREYIPNLWRMRSHRAAYEAISFEVTARFVVSDWAQRHGL